VYCHFGQSLIILFTAAIMSDITILRNLPTASTSDNKVRVKYEFTVEMSVDDVNNMVCGDFYDPDQVADIMDEHFYDNYQSFHNDSSKYPHVVRGKMSIDEKQNIPEVPKLRRDHHYTSSSPNAPDREGMDSDEEDEEFKDSLFSLLGDISNSCLWVENDLLPLARARISAP